MTPLAHFASIVGPLIVALVTYYATDGLARWQPWVNGLNPHLKRGVVLAIASVISLVAHYTATTLPTDLALWDPTTIDTLVSAILAMAVKAGESAKAAKAEAHDALEIAATATHHVLKRGDTPA
jgi:hypothetical protein